VSARSYLWEFSLAGAFGMHRSRQNIHDPTNSCDRFCYEIAKNAGTLESESPFIWQVAGLVFTFRFFRNQEKVIIGEREMISSCKTGGPELSRLRRCVEIISQLTR